MTRAASLLTLLPVLALGCTDAPIILPRAIVDVNVKPSAVADVPAGSCNLAAADLVSIGCAGSASRCADNTEGNFLSVAHGGRVAADGTPAPDGTEVHVYCSIVSSGRAFEVGVSALRVSTKDPNTNTEKITIRGTIDPAVRTGQSVTVFASKQGIAAFQTNPPSKTTGAHQGLGCTLSFPEDFMGVASGRLWARVDCPDAFIPTQDSRMCDVSGTLRFENCGE